VKGWSNKVKIICNKDFLLEALSKVSRAVPAQSAIKETTGVLVSGKKDTVTLTGYDLSIGIVCDIEGNVAEEGSVIIPPPFLEIVRRLNGEEITISVGEDNMILIESGFTKFDLFGLPSDGYPELPIFSDEFNFELPQSILRRLIRQTVFAVSQTEARPVMQGVMFELENGILTLAALDGFRMAISKENIGYHKNGKFIIPGKTLNEILRLLGDSDVVSLSVGKTHASFLINGCKIYTRLITQGEFINYKSIIPTTYNTAVKINTRALIDSVEKVSLLVETQATKRAKNSIVVRFADNVTALGCVTMAGKAQDRISCEITGNDIEVGINNSYILDALRAAECDEIVLRLTTTFAAIKIVPPEGDSFSFLVMPVRTKNED